LYSVRFDIDDEKFVSSKLFILIDFFFVRFSINGEKFVKYFFSVRFNVTVETLLVKNISVRLSSLEQLIYGGNGLDNNNTIIYLMKDNLINFSSLLDMIFYNKLHLNGGGFNNIKTFCDC